MNNKMIFCLLVTAFFAHSLSCSDLNKPVNPIAQKFIAVGYLDNVYSLSPIYRAQVDVATVKISNEDEKFAAFGSAITAYVTQVAAKYPKAPQGFDFKSRVDAHLLNLGEDGTGLLMQYVVAGHRVQIVAAKLHKE